MEQQEEIFVEIGGGKKCKGSTKSLSPNNNRAQICFINSKQQKRNKKI